MDPDCSNHHKKGVSLEKKFCQFFKHQLLKVCDQIFIRSLTSAVMLINHTDPGFPHPERLILYYIKNFLFDPTFASAHKNWDGERFKLSGYSTDRLLLCEWVLAQTLYSFLWRQAKNRQTNDQTNLYNRLCGWLYASIKIKKLFVSYTFPTWKNFRTFFESVN